MSIRGALVRLSGSSLAAALLLLPAIAMQFSSEMIWGPGDFLAAVAQQHEKGAQLTPPLVLNHTVPDCTPVMAMPVTAPASLSVTLARPLPFKPTRSLTKLPAVVSPLAGGKAATCTPTADSSAMLTSRLPPSKSARAMRSQSQRSLRHQ